MPLRKKYKSQKSFIKKVKRPSSTKDTTIANMAGFGQSKGKAKDYGKVKSKGGVKKVKANKLKSK